MGVSGQRHATAALYPRGNVHIVQESVSRAGLDTEVRRKISCLCRESNVDRPVVQSIARHSSNTVDDKSSNNSITLLNLCCESWHSNKVASNSVWLAATCKLTSHFHCYLILALDTGEGFARTPAGIVASRCEFYVVE